MSRKALAPNQPSTGTATVTTSYTYDALNRLTGKSYNDGSTAPVKYGYDGVPLTGCTTTPPGQADSNPKGNRTSMCDGSGGTSWAHDAMGRVLTERRTIGKANGLYNVYSYNLAGMVLNVTSLSQGLAYTYGGAGRPLTAEGGSTNYATTATYAAPGELAGLKVGTGITITNSYNNRLQPSVLSAATSSQTIYSRSYGFNWGSADNGNVLQVANNLDNTRNQTFVYDPLNRIQQATSNGPAWGEAYTIDSWGNLTNRSLVSGKNNSEPFPANTTVNTLNQLTSSNMGYDAAGNMISDAGYTYVYDAENRITSVAGFTYVYDGDGKRVEKCLGTSCATSTSGQLYWYGTDDAAQVESDLNGNVLHHYVFFNGQRIARFDTSDSTAHYYFSDQVGSHDMVTSTTGACEQDIDFYAYGGIETDFCPNRAQNYKFDGKERDSESGLDNFGARYNASSMGRFMSPDAGEDAGFDHMSDPQSWNGYAYVRNNPTTLTDPDGNNYSVCDTNGQNCADLTNDQYNQYLQSIQGTNTTVNSAGQIQYTNDNGSVTNLGTASYYNEQDVAAARMLVQTGVTLSDPRTIAGFYGASFLLGGCAIACPAGGSAALTLGRGVYYALAGLLPAVPSAIDKLQKLGVSISEANELIESPTTQKLIDNANNGNINYIADVGGKLVRITTDPAGQRIISAGIVRANQITNGIANGRFTQP